MLRDPRNRHTVVCALGYINDWFRIVVALKSHMPNASRYMGVHKRSGMIDIAFCISLPIIDILCFLFCKSLDIFIPCWAHGTYRRLPSSYRPTHTFHEWVTSIFSKTSEASKLNKVITAIVVARRPHNFATFSVWGTLQSRDALTRFPAHGSLLIAYSTVFLSFSWLQKR